LGPAFGGSQQIHTQVQLPGPDSNPPLYSNGLDGRLPYELISVGGAPNGFPRLGNPAIVTNTSTIALGGANAAFASNFGDGGGGLIFADGTRVADPTVNNTFSTFANYGQVSF